MDQIEHIYEAIYVQRSIIVCNNAMERDNVIRALEARDYPMDRILVTTFLDLDFEADYSNDVTVIFTFDLDNIGPLCEFGCRLVVAL